MRKKFLILLSVLMINVIALTLTSMPALNAAPAADEYGWYYSIPCPCDEQEEASGHYTCERAECHLVGDLWVCVIGWDPIECGEPFNPVPTTP